MCDKIELTGSNNWEVKKKITSCKQSRIQQLKERKNCFFLFKFQNNELRKKKSNQQLKHDDVDKAEI